MARLSGKVSIVTGSSRGIGPSIAERMGEDGATVVVNSNRNHGKALEAVAAIEGEGRPGLRRSGRAGPAPPPLYMGGKAAGAFLAGDEAR